MDIPSFILGLMIGGFVAGSFLVFFDYWGW